MTVPSEQRRARLRRPTATSLTAVMLLAGLGTVTAVALPVGVAGAATAVTNCKGSGPGSLRATVASAAPGDTITFSVTCPGGSPIVLTSTLDIAKNLTVDGPGASKLVVSGGNTVVVVTVDPGVTTAISGITVEDGSNADYEYGGGIENMMGTVSLSDSTVSHNSTTGSGGGISNLGTFSLTDSTVSDNSSLIPGGGVWNVGTMRISDSTVSDNSSMESAGGGIDEEDGPLTVTDSTISGNVASNGGGGVWNVGGTVRATNSTIANNSAGTTGGGLWTVDDAGISGSTVLSDSTVSGNSAPAGAGGGVSDSGSVADPVGGTTKLSATIVAESLSGGECSGAVSDAGYNLADDTTCSLTAPTSLPDTPSGLDPAGLKANGGPTQTVALAGLSPAISHVGKPADCPATDQRGTKRNFPCSIGAYEGQPSLVDLHNYLLLNRFFYLWPDPPPDMMGVINEGTVGYLPPTSGPGLLDLYGCEDGGVGNYLSVDQSGKCEADTHAAPVTGLGVVGYLFAEPPTNGTKTAELYRCVDAGGADYLETTLPPVSVSAQERCGDDPTDYGFDKSLGYLVTAAGVPKITGFTPLSGPPGTTVTIKGDNLSGATKVALNGAALTITQDTATTIKATIPPRATTGTIEVATLGEIVKAPTPFRVT